jgi:hypothetical protein
MKFILDILSTFSNLAVGVAVEAEVFGAGEEEAWRSCTEEYVEWV